MHPTIVEVSIFKKRAKISFLLLKRDGIGKMLIRGNNNMNILAIIPHFFPHIGGGETHLYQLANRLTEKGHKIEILTLKLPGTVAFEKTGNIAIHRFENDSDLTEQGYADILNYLKKNEFKDTVLYGYLNVGTSNVRTTLMIEILNIARKKSIPRVVRITSSGRVTKLLEIFPSGIEELCQTDYVIALNSGIQKELIDVGVLRSKIKSISNGVDLQMFFPIPQMQKSIIRSKLGYPTSGRVFFSASRLTPKKRIPDLICLWDQMRAYPAIKDQTSELWVLGGDHREKLQLQMYEMLIKQIREWKITNIKVIPSVQHKEIPQYFQSADFYITLSIEEGMSNAMLEAMATGLIVIAPATEAVINIVKDNWNGFLFTPGDLISAKEAMARALETPPGQLEKMSKRNHKLICTYFNFDIIADSFSILFNSLSI